MRGLVRITPLILKTYSTTVEPTQGFGVNNNHPITNGKLQVMANGCVEYTGCRDSDGYGDITVDGKGWAAHRFTWAQLFGDIPVGMCVLHSCDNPSCVNPEHLWLGTLQDNVKDMDRKGRRGCGPGKGEKNHSWKYSDQHVQEMRDYYNGPGCITLDDLTRKFGVSRSQASRIVRKESR